jgi:hypothetical protein
MPQEELHGTRDRTYSAWHRRLSVRRFVGIERAQTLAMIDLDASLYVEYDDGSKEPLALIETAIDRGQCCKSSTVTKKLAERASLPAFVLLYTPSADKNEADSEWPDIERFRVRRVHNPFFSTEPAPFDVEWQTVTPQQWADFLVRLRVRVCGRLDQEIGLSDG